MPTIYSRIQFLRLTVPHDRKITIGKKVAEAYFKIPIEKRPPLFKKESFEGIGNVFQVWCYPKRFVPTIDKIIKEICKDIAPNKRSRIRGQKVASQRKR